MFERELTDLEKSLAALKPSAPALGRDRLMYRLGQISVRRWVWLWPSAAIVAAGGAAVLGAVLWLRPLPEPTVKIVRIPAPASPTNNPPTAPRPQEPPDVLGMHQSTPAANSWSYWQLQRQALRFGTEGLPERPAIEEDDFVPALRPAPVTTAGVRPAFNSSGDR